MLPKRTLLAAACAALLPGLSWAQGTDACAMAQPILGPGIFNFDNSFASTDGVPDPLCDAFGSSDVESDVWFAWTAMDTAPTTLSTCNGTTVDTKVAILDGSCGGVVLDCNDDACGLQSTVSWSATAGQVYLLRVGTFPGATGGTGTFEITASVPQINPANGHAYQAIPATGISWDDARLEAESLVFNGAQGHLAVITDDAEDTWIWNNLSPAADLGDYWLGGFQDLNAPDYSEPIGGWRWVTGETWAFTDWWPGEPNDNPAPEDFLIYIPTNLEPSGMWNDAGPNYTARGYIVEFEGSGLGENYCVAANNSTGSGAAMRALGSLSVSNNDLRLQTEPVPDQPGLFFYGPNQILAPFGNGFRCVGGIVGRLAVENASGGLLTHDFDNTSPPNGNVIVTPGSTWNFQAWYRDPAAGGANFNLSDGLELTFTP